jgi:PAS domain S-box-containing protein
VRAAAGGAHRGDQAGQGHRLAEEAAPPDTGHPVAGGRDDRHRQVGQLPIAFDLGQELPAVHDRHEQVEQDRARADLVGHLEGFAAVASRDDVEAFQLEELAHRLPDGLVVLDYQDAAHAKIVSLDAAPAAVDSILVSRRDRSESIALLEAAFSAAPIGLAVVDRELRYVVVNEALAAMNGVSPADHVGRTVGEVHPEIAHQLEPIYRGVFISGEPSVERELPATTASGQERVLLASHYPMAGAAGEVVAVRTVVEDVTDDARLRGAEAALRHALTARDVFLSIASHELRTPLQSLQLVLDGLIRHGARPPTPDHVARKLDLMRSQIQRLGMLIDNLLTVSRMASGELSLDPDEIDLGDVVREVMGRFAPGAARAGVSLHLEADPDLNGQWDPLRLEEIVSNLLSNAIKFGRGGTVDVAALDCGDEVRLSVKDQGIGIAREDRERIFDRFERAASEKSYGGIGMGLWIVRQLVRAHGGTIEVVSAPGAGATFIVTLPRESAAADRPLESPLPLAPPQPSA